MKGAKPVKTEGDEQSVIAGAVGRILVEGVAKEDGNCLI